jgi:DNA-binding LytR/AlgR family response regulator
VPGVFEILKKELYNRGETMRVAICDDNILELENIKNVLLGFIKSKQVEDEIILETFGKGHDLLDFIHHVSSFDLIVLDILMPGMTGIEAASKIRETDNDCKIIFLTSSPEFAVNSYKVNAFYYLLKPFQNNELLTLLDKAMISIQTEQSKSIVIKGKNRLMRIPLNMIEYIESVKHTLNFHLRGGEPASCYAKMEEFREYLLADKRFVRCHQSYIVNMSMVAQINSKNFVLQDKTLIPLQFHKY